MDAAVSIQILPRKNRRHRATTALPGGVRGNRDMHVWTREEEVAEALVFVLPPVHELKW
jgi:hypothetical protein